MPIEDNKKPALSSTRVEGLVADDGSAVEVVVQVVELGSRERRSSRTRSMLSRNRSEVLKSLETDNSVSRWSHQPTWPVFAGHTA